MHDLLTAWVQGLTLRFGVSENLFDFMSASSHNFSIQGYAGCFIISSKARHTSSLEFI